MVVSNDYRHKLDTERQSCRTEIRKLKLDASRTLKSVSLSEYAGNTGYVDWNSMVGRLGLAQ